MLIFTDNSSLSYEKLFFTFVNNSGMGYQNTCQVLPSDAGIDTLSTKLCGDILPDQIERRLMFFEAGLGSVAILHDGSRAQLDLTGKETTTTLIGDSALSLADRSEARLVGQFLGLVEEISPDLGSLMVPMPEAEIRDPTAFTLTPVVAYEGGDPVTRTRSTDTVGEGIPVDPILTDLYLRAPNISYFLDSRFAIGLDYMQGVIAIAAAGVDHKNNLFINQIQASSLIHRRGGDNWQKFNESGLNHGFKWRRSLVNAWAQIAMKVGCSAVVIQSHENNKWDVVKRRGKKAYDDVASDLGFDQQDDKNWLWTL